MAENNDILRGFADNEALVSAVRELILKHLSLDDVTTLTSDEAMGQMIRARIYGREAIAAAFREIAQYKSVSKPVDKPNPAR